MSWFKICQSQWSQLYYYLTNCNSRNLLFYNCWKRDTIQNNHNNHIYCHLMNYTRTRHSIYYLLLIVILQLLEKWHDSKLDHHNYIINELQLEKEICYPTVAEKVALSDSKFEKNHYNLMKLNETLKYITYYRL